MPYSLWVSSIRDNNFWKYNLWRNTQHWSSTRFILLVGTGSSDELGWVGRVVMIRIMIKMNISLVHQINWIYKYITKFLFILYLELKLICIHSGGSQNRSLCKWIFFTVTLTFHSKCNTIQFALLYIEALRIWTNKNRLKNCLGLSFVFIIFLSPSILFIPIVTNFNYHIIIVFL